MTHSEAIALIRDGGLYVRLLLRKTNAPPPSLDGENIIDFVRKYSFRFRLEVKIAMGNGIESTNTHWKASPYT
jgi:hypothetical protein